MESSDRLDDQIFVRNLSFETSNQDLTGLFEPFGPLKRVSIAVHPETKQSRGYGFVAMAISADAAKAVQELKGKTLNGRQIQLELAAKRGTSIVGENKAKSTPVDSVEQLRRQKRKERALKGKTEKTDASTDTKKGEKDNSDSDSSRHTEAETASAFLTTWFRLDRSQHVLL